MMIGYLRARGGETHQFPFVIRPPQKASMPGQTLTLMQRDSISFPYYGYQHVRRCRPFTEDDFVRRVW